VTDSQANLIARARTFVRTGGTIEVTLPSGSVVGGPVAIMSFTPEMIWFLFAGDDHPHGSEVTSIQPGDDGQVLVVGDGDKLISIWGTWEQEQRDDLDAWLEGTKIQQVYLGVSPEPPEIVRYEGHRP